MKTLVIFGYNLDVGGIEKSLINLINALNKDYKITLVLRENKGFLKNKLPKNIKVETYKISKSSSVLYRKMFNRVKLYVYKIKNYKKYDISINFVPYDIPFSLLAKSYGVKKIYWIHSDYSLILNKNEFNSFFNKRKIKKYDRLVFVSNESLSHFTDNYDGSKIPKQEVLNNIVDTEEIINLSNEKLDIETNNNEEKFVFVGRLEEKSKKISRLLTSFKEYLKKNSKGKLWIVGDGPDKHDVLNRIKESKLQDNVVLFGNQKNPYKFIKLADCVLLTSDYEGFPVVLLEALILNKKVISTINVSSPGITLSEYINVVPKDSKSILKAMINVSHIKEPNIDYVKINNQNKKRILNFLEDL